MWHPPHQDQRGRKSWHKVVNQGVREVAKEACLKLTPKYRLGIYFSVLVRSLGLYVLIEVSETPV